MNINIALKGIPELAHVLKSGGYLYCNPITEVYFAGERIVTTQHEHGTIQSYFDKVKIDSMFTGSFEILSCELHSIKDAVTEAWAGRWHLVLRRC